jgi:hypothetical protein
VHFICSLVAFKICFFFQVVLNSVIHFAPTNRLKLKRFKWYFQVEAYIKEHIRPLCKSGVISVKQYRWAVGKTTEKVMKFHQKDKNANFLIKEGDKVKKLAEQYIEAAQKKGDV